MEAINRSRLLAASGLIVIDSELSGAVSEPTGAWRIVISGDVVPSITVPILDDGQHFDEVQSQWELLSVQCGIFDDQGEFLISPAGVGASRLGWARVRRQPNLRLAHCLAADYEGPEFVAMALDGHAVCGVTAEEYDVWVVGNVRGSYVRPVDVKHG